MVTSFGWQILALGDTFFGDISYSSLDQMMVQHSRSTVWNLLVVMIRHFWIWKKKIIGGQALDHICFILSVIFVFSGLVILVLVVLGI